MRSFVIGASVLAAGASSPQELFKDFMKKYDRHYPTESEKEKRFQIFSENMEMIEASNAKGHSYTLGITANTDRTFEEWRADYITGFKPTLAASKNRDVFVAPEGFETPDSVDWVSKGGVTSVKNQGTCGSCWTFSTVGGLEGAMFVAGRKLVDLSMQHILACDTSGAGCKGGQMDQAFDWVAANGVPSLSDEPYLCKDATSSDCKAMTCGAATNKTDALCNLITGACTKYNSTCGHELPVGNTCECQGGLCFVDKACGKCPPEPAMVLAVGDVTKHTDVGSTEDALEAAVAQQPVSVAIEADQAVFQHYKSGVLTDDACGSNLDHGVLAVGYGTDAGQKYWKVKNSWGSDWGDNGYIRLERGAAGSGECGIRKMASFPTVKASSYVV